MAEVPRFAYYFKDEILSGKIVPHVINDHYKGKWNDLVDAARRKDEETR